MYNSMDKAKTITSHVVIAKPNGQTTLPWTATKFYKTNYLGHSFIMPRSKMMRNTTYKLKQPEMGIKNGMVNELTIRCILSIHFLRHFSEALQ